MTGLGTEPSTGREREPIAVFREDGVVEGWIPKEEGRISDGLNDADMMRVGTETADGEATNWLEFGLDEVIAVAPAPRPVSPLRVSRRRHLVEVDAGPYRVRGTAHLREGDPRSEIVEEANSSNADLIVVGSHGRTGVERWVMGSVAESVVAHAPCSVEVVRRRRTTESGKGAAE